MAGSPPFGVEVDSNLENQGLSSNRTTSEKVYYILSSFKKLFTFKIVFLSKPLKEGILSKAKKLDQLKKTKPVRLVLSNNFLYYFPFMDVRTFLYSFFLTLI